MKDACYKIQQLKHLPGKYDTVGSIPITLLKNNKQIKQKKIVSLLLKLKKVSQREALEFKRLHTKN